MKQIFRLLAVTSLALSAFVAQPALATENPQLAPSPAPLAAPGGPCTGPDEGFHTGFSTSDSSYNDGAAGYINISDTVADFNNCGDIGLPSASSAWVGISSDAPGWPAIIQIGIVQCDAITYPSFCNGADTPHYFAYWSGCFPGSVTRDLGVADWGTHFYRVSQADSNGNWYFYIDNVQKFVLSGTDPLIWCWDDEPNRAQFSGERFNRGDSLGRATPGAFLTFTSLMHYREDTHSWVPEVGIACLAEPTSGVGRSYCIHGDDAMAIYTQY